MICIAATSTNGSVKINNLHFVGSAFYMFANFIAVNIAFPNQYGRGNIRKQLKDIQSLSIGMRGKHIELAGFENQLPHRECLLRLGLGY